MRWAMNMLFLILGLAVRGQEVADTTGVWTSSSWTQADYGQEGRIYNRIHHFFENNPALAGFDRRLNVRYGFTAEKLSLGYHASDGTFRHAFHEHRVAVDGPFGIRSDRWGMGLAYVRRREGRHLRQQVEFAHSGRIDMGRHHLIFGAGAQLNLSELDQGDLLFGDMIDPRYGAVYQTAQWPLSGRSTILGLSVGMRYYWRRFRFDYNYRQEPRVFAYAGVSPVRYFHRFATAYHFRIDEDITLSPEVLVSDNVSRTWLASAFVTVTYRDVAYCQLGLADHNRMTFALGGQIKEWVTLQAGSSFYTDPVMVEIAGVATVEARLWFHWDYFKKKKG